MSIFSDIGNFVSSAVSTAVNVGMAAAQVAFPELAVANAAMNLLQGAMGQGIQGALQQLMQQSGMPPFVAKEIGNILNQVLGQLQQPTDPACQQQVQDQSGNSFSDFASQFSKSIVDSMGDDIKAKCGGGKGGGASWFEALAAALGKALNDQADNVKNLSQAVEGKGANDDPKGFTDLQAASQRMSFMMSAADQVIKTLGEALSTAARKG
jgi:hypothetical protein